MLQVATHGISHMIIICWSIKCDRPICVSFDFNFENQNLETQSQATVSPSNTDIYKRIETKFIILSVLPSYSTCSTSVYRGRPLGGIAKRSTTCDKSMLSMIDFSQEITTKSLNRCDVVLDRTADFTKATLLWLRSQVAVVTDTVSSVTTNLCLPCAYLVWPCLEVNPHDKA